MIEIDVLNYANIIDKLQRLNYEVIAREKMFKYIANHNFEHFEERYNIFMEDYTIKLYDYYSNNYSYKTILKKNQFITNISVKNSNVKEFT